MSFLFAETDKRIEAEPRLLESGFVPFFEIRLISGFLQCSPNERKTTLELSSRRVSLGSFRYANHRERYKSQVEQSDLPSEEELARCIDRPTNPEEEVSSRRAIKAHRFSRLKRIHSADERINFLRLGAAGANILGIVAHAESLRKRGNFSNFLVGTAWYRSRGMRYQVRNIVASFLSLPAFRAR